MYLSLITKKYLNENALPMDPHWQAVLQEPGSRMVSEDNQIICVYKSSFQVM